MVFDVHINRTPIAGTIRQVVYISGKFLNADLDKASEENERQHIVVEGGDGVRIGFTQIAGLVARRIVPFVKPGDMVAAGQRVGLIRFGSRVDVYPARRHRAAGRARPAQRSPARRSSAAIGGARGRPASRSDGRRRRSSVADVAPPPIAARGMPLRAVAPNAVTALALCSGLTGDPLRDRAANGRRRWR